MLQSIVHCHRLNIVHRDVKLDNFLIDPSGEDELLVKLSDFGLACHFDSDNLPNSICGSILSIAPEMLLKTSYDHKVDLWGLGIILYELFSK